MIAFRAERFGGREALEEWPLAHVKTVQRVFGTSAGTPAGGVKELIELGKFCNDLAKPKSSEIVLWGEPFFLFSFISLRRS